MIMFSRSFCTALVTCAIGASVGTAAQDWKVTSGSIQLHLDSKAFAKLGIDMPTDVMTGDNSGVMTLIVSVRESDMTFSTTAGHTAAHGWLRTGGEYYMQLGIGPDGAPSTIGNLVFQVSPTGANLTDQIDVGKTLFEITPGTLQVSVTGDKTAINGELAISKGLARVLHRADLEGQPVGMLVGETGIAPTTPVHPTGLGGIAGGTLNGPDVIVSTVSSVTRYGTAVGGITGYATTTVSCNLGEADAIWIDCTSGSNCNQHPVISENMYRLRTVNGAKQFEQIGISWLKHGFCAADAPSCGSPYEPNGSCDWLGTFATDTYSASLNADQTNLGPRSEVNPWTGVYPYPYILAWNATGNAIYKRLQIHNTDLDPAQNTGALYWHEGHYVCTDEQPINRYNNLSYRSCTVAVSAGQYNITSTGSTVAQQPAINAWAANEAGVTLRNLDASNDGRFVMGYKVTQLSPTSWHYEFAVFNMNANAAAQAFSVPIPNGVNVSNIGFHNSPHHSGEPYSTADWTSSLAAGFLTWQCEAKAVNINANALRWGTQFNFRFDADAPPADDDVSLTMFNTSEVLTTTASRPSGVICVAPHIDTQPASQAVTFHNPVTFTVAASGSAVLTYQWQKDGSDISGATNSSYSIASAEYSDAADYVVIVSNACGFDTSVAATLTVNPGCLLGDANCDGAVNNFDIQYWVYALLNDPIGYVNAGGDPNCLGLHNCWGDSNPDGVQNNFDIDPFVACILATPPAGQPCP